jgi:predicted GIY-YIG superfamily endonuclease
MIKNMDIISKDEQVEGRYFKRGKDIFGYKIPNVPLDKDIYIGIKYGILDISLEGNIIFPKGCGAYVITTESISIYVGSTKDISKRLKRHISEQRIRVHPNIFERIKNTNICYRNSCRCKNFRVLAHKRVKASVKFGIFA